MFTPGPSLELLLQYLKDPDTHVHIADNHAALLILRKYHQTLGEVQGEGRTHGFGMISE